MSYANVLASAGVVGAQYRTARDAGVTLSNLHFAPADVVAAAWRLFECTLLITHLSIKSGGAN
jgi:hypothetical protein